jgi:aromatic ring-opening dioxygenase LigB subunit
MGVGWENLKENLKQRGKMLQRMPSWYSEAKRELDKAIIDIAQKYNLKICFVMDSKSIDNAKDTILQAMVSIYDNASGQFTQEELKEFQIIEDAMKNDKQFRVKKRKN